MKLKHLFFVVATMVIFIANANAQRGYTEFETEENIKVMYRWHRANIFQKDSDAVLNLRVTNLSESAVTWSFSVGFYEEGVLLYQSEISELCLKPRQSRRGALAGLNFSVEGLKLEKTESSTFSWEFGAFDVDEVESCN